MGIAGSLLVGEWMSELVLDGRTATDTATQDLTRFGTRYGERGGLQADCQAVYGNFYSLERGAF